MLCFFHALGIPVREGYGMTECTGFSFVQRQGEVRPGTVGAAIPELEFRLATTGSCSCAGETDLPRLLPQPEGHRRVPARTAGSTAATWPPLDPDGQLRIVDRKKAIFVTAGGKNVSPSLVENALKVSPYVKEAVVLGRRGEVRSAPWSRSTSRTSASGRRSGSSPTPTSEPAALPQVLELVAREVERANDGLAPVEQVRNFRLLEKELDHDDNEVTATMKVRRKTIEEKFGPLIREIYK